MIVCQNYIVDGNASLRQPIPSCLRPVMACLQQSLLSLLNQRCQLHVLCYDIVAVYYGVNMGVSVLHCIMKLCWHIVRCRLSCIFSTTPRPRLLIQAFFGLLYSTHCVCAVATMLLLPTQVPFVIWCHALSVDSINRSFAQQG